MIRETAEAASQAASKAMYAGSAVASGAWGACEFKLTGDDVTAAVGVAGLLVAIAGFATNFWFGLRRDRRERAAMAKSLNG